MHGLVFSLIQSPIFEWSMVWCGAKSGYPKGIMCLEEIGWFARNMITTMSSMVNLIGGDLYDHPMSMKMFHFENE